MKEIKLTIDGKEIQLTDEQLKALGTKVRKNPFERSKPHDPYYYVYEDNDVWSDTDLCADADNRRYDAANYFNDRQFAEQVALHQLLYHKLLRYAYDNECEDTAEWNGRNRHFAIRYDDVCNVFTVYDHNIYKAHEVYFSSEEGAKRAIEEVVEPFMKEHPEFVW